MVARGGRLMAWRGLWTLKQLGGTTVVQDPEEALFPGMPLNALRAGDVDSRLPIAEMPGVLAQLARADARPDAIRCA
jgi:two-component system, chemotaxis family, protein-glutamate methylesterase/glutaminase